LTLDIDLAIFSTIFLKSLSSDIRKIKHVRRALSCRVLPLVGHLVSTFSNFVPLFCNLENLPTVASSNEKAVLDQLD
jgi:hypothetical protein